ncbi:MAG: cytochrome c [Pseudomonadota bacterium]
MRRTLTLLLAITFSTGLSAAESLPDSARQTELLYLLKHDCGSCHGMTRQGGLGPPLLPENLDDRPQLLLVNTVLDGRNGTPMPPWRGQLTAQEAQWLVEVLRAGEGL